MRPYDFIYNAIYQKSIMGGATNESASNHADMGVIQYRQNRFKTVSKLIDERVKAAVKFKEKK